MIQIALSTTAASYINEFSDNCRQSGYKLLWIAIGNTDDIHREKHHYHAMRYQFNCNENKDLLIIDPNGTTVSQTKEDDKQYEYKGELIEDGFYSGSVHNFCLVRPVSELRIIDGKLTIDGFSDRFNLWMKNKSEAFERMKSQIDVAEKSRVQQAALRLFQANNTWKRDGRKWKRCDFEKRTNKIETKPVKKVRYRHTRPTSKNIEDYRVGIGVLHSKHGCGVITEVVKKTDLWRIIKVCYQNGQLIEHELDRLIRAGTISIE